MATLNSSKTLGLLLVVALLLQACATEPPPTPATPASAPPASMNAWRVSGKAALRNGERSETVNLIWSRLAPNIERLQLSGALGLGAMQFDRRGSDVTWLDGNIPRPIDTLPLEDGLNESLAVLPFEQLGNWLLGHTPSDASAAGWAVTVSQWQTVDVWRVPRTMTLKRGPLRIKLVLMNWALDANP